MSTRTALIRLAHSRPELRPTLLPLITRTAMEFQTQDALDKYLEAHPNADKSKHSIKKDEKDSKGKDSKEPAGAESAAKSKSTISDSGKLKPKRTKSEKYGVFVEGISEGDLDKFFSHPEGKELQDKYNLRLIAGGNGAITAQSLERATTLRRKLKTTLDVAKKHKDNIKKKQEEKGRALTHEEKDALLSDADRKVLDVCTASPPVCDGNMGIERSSMPQFLQVPVKEALHGVTDKRYKELLKSEAKGDDLPGEEVEAFYNRKNAEAAVEAGADPESDRSVFDDFVSSLKKKGIKSTTLTVDRDAEGTPSGGLRVGDLKATQSEISADKVLKNADKYLDKVKGGKVGGDVIYVSRDNHILDGHHRWAGLLAADPDTRIPVVQLDMNMKDLLSESFAQDGVFRQDFNFQTMGKDDPIDLAYQKGETWKQKNGKWYGKNAQGKAGGPYDTQASAKNCASGKKAASLRSGLIRLAHSRPDLRHHILPILSE